ncbi:MAG: CRTAC1 family protein [Gammaproteobacteria bacterium]|nr:CRTAC1 family protein [Gammaproteobacteria bacterium]
MPRRPLSKRQRLMLYWGGASGAAIVAATMILLIAKPQLDPYAPEADGSVAGLTSVLSRTSTAAMVQFSFAETRESAGIDFRHFPATRRSLLPEDMGSGIAWGDYDDDGDLDLYLVNFCRPADTQMQSAGCRSALYANDGSGHFSDVTTKARLDTPVAGLGATWGDYDNDDDLDLYLTNFGANTLYRNNGDGSFSDATESAGVGDNAFSAGGAWGDYDNDGNIDLYVTNYVRFELREGDIERRSRHTGSEVPYTLNPSAYPPEPNRLYRNNGDGSFTDVADAAGVANHTGRSLASSWVDLDGDGLLDLYVANDVSSNGVFRNMGDGTFADIGASSLAADYRGAMGLAVGDYDGDADFDIFVTHWVAQENAFFENMSSEDWVDSEGRDRLAFMDVADAIGLGQASLPMVGWSTGFADFDNDADPDLWIVNGNTLEQSADNKLLRPQLMQIFTHESPGGFYDAGTHAGTILATPIVGRGGAQGDFDADGKIDLCILVHGAKPLLLHNVTDSENHWLGVRLRQHGANTRGLGARVALRTGDRIQLRQVGVGGAYLSHNDTDLHFGLANTDSVDEITIHWPDGATESHQGIPADQVVTFTHEPNYLN